MSVSVQLAAPADWAGWRRAVRDLVLADIPPARVHWRVGDGAADLFGGGAVPRQPAREAAFAVPRAFLDLAEQAICHRDPERFALLHELLLRVRRDRHVLRHGTDPLVMRVQRLAQAVRRDIHKMHAFVRFRRVAEDGADRYIAWFEPEHHIVAAAAPFFARRFAAMTWSILTPEQCVHWDGGGLSFTPGAARSAAPADDALEELWRTYYANIFNPARLKVAMMQSEMPRKYWRNLPEAPLIRPLIAAAARRTETMAKHGATAAKANPQKLTETASAGLPPRAPLEVLRHEAEACRRCTLWRPATRVVFGAGPQRAEIMLVGEQPGDEEDLAGTPFAGPAGRILERALAEAGLARERLYVTDAVKHFKFDPHGRRRVHRPADAAEVRACRWWLERELAAVKPRLVVALGETAVLSLSGGAMTLAAAREGEHRTPEGMAFIATVHPSALPRLPDAATRAREYERFVADLKRAV